jgi:hypothetical protein
MIDDGRREKRADMTIPVDHAKRLRWAIAEGWRPMHNRIRHGADTPRGLYFWVPPDVVEEGLVIECCCGWRPDLGRHYRPGEHWPDVPWLNRNSMAMRRRRRTISDNNT